MGHLRIEGIDAGGMLAEGVAGRLPLHLDRLHPERVDLLESEPVLGRVPLVPARRNEDAGYPREYLAEQLRGGGPALIRLGEELGEHLDAEADVALLVA